MHVERKQYCSNWRRARDTLMHPPSTGIRVYANEMISVRVAIATRLTPIIF